MKIEVEVGHRPDIKRARALIAAAVNSRTKTDEDVAAARRDYAILRGRALITAGRDLLASVDAEDGDR